jgi:hypothetical protein
MYPLVNEGFKILGEGIAASAADVDVIWREGYSLPRWRGGPMYWAAEEVRVGRAVCAVYVGADDDAMWALVVCRSVSGRCCRPSGATTRRRQGLRIGSLPPSSRSSSKTPGLAGLGFKSDCSANEDKPSS